jgi:hypothetical protein
MKNSQTIKYKRGNVRWWVLLILWGIYVHMIFGYIHQWGNNPIQKSGLIIFGVVWIVVSVLVIFIRLIVTIDDDFVKFKSFNSDKKIHFTQIEDVSVEKENFIRHFKLGEEYHDFTNQVLKIQTKSGKIYQIAIKNAQKIKAEIEKRISKSNHIS